MCVSVCVGEPAGIGGWASREEGGRHWRESQYQSLGLFLCAQMSRCPNPGVQTLVSGKSEERERECHLVLVVVLLGATHVVVPSLGAGHSGCRSLGCRSLGAGASTLQVPPIIPAPRGGTRGYFGAPHGRINYGEPVTRLANDSPRSPPNGSAVWYLFPCPSPLVHGVPVNTNPKIPTNMSSNPI